MVCFFFCFIDPARIWPLLRRGDVCYNHRAYMQRYISEVVVIRKILTSLFLALLLASVLPVAEAATLESRAGAVTTTSGSLNVRSSGASSASVVGSLKKGSYITLLEKNGNWWKVEYAKGKVGYCHSDYITVVEGTPVNVKTNSGSLNVRSGAGTSYSTVDRLSKGETVLFLQFGNGWSRILYHGTKTGYVSAQYLSNYNQPVSLAVPGFKQTDSRWKDTIIASSGKTFAQIGCATTAIAMMESYRKETTVYPDTMAKQLRYTSAGDVYWPAHYSAVTDSRNYLTAILQKLKQGKPVLFGAVNSYGAQHWVVITGYVGGIGLSASDFMIEDPGTHSRINLQQFLNSYPSFYKYFHY